jgi:hypothetical protein
MPKTIHAEVVGTDKIDYVFVRLEGKTRLLNPSIDRKTHEGTITVEIIGDLQVYLLVDADYGTQFTFSLILDGKDKPFFEPKQPPLETDTFNSFSHTWNIPSP